MAARALERIAQLRARQRAGRSSSAPRATWTSTSTSSTRRTSAPIEQRRVCSKEDEEVDWEEVAHGYELDGKQVVLTDEELAAVEPRKTRTIDIEAFVDARRRRPDLLRPPVLPGAGRRERGHAARVPAARRGDGATEQAALGRFVMRTKEYLVLRPRRATARWR